MTLALLLPSLALAAPLGAFETKLTAAGSADNMAFGASVSTGGDVDGDGFDEVVVGASRADSVHLFRGGVDGVLLSTEQVVEPSDGGDIGFGQAAGGGADLDGDGFDDLVVGAAGDDDNGDGAGAAYVYYGAASGFDLTREEKLTPTSIEAGGSFGRAVAMLGDVNDDGFDDAAFSAPYDGDGSVFVYLGSAGGLDQASEVW